MRKLLYFLKYLKKGKVTFTIAVLAGIGFGAMSGLGIPVIFEKVFKQVFEADPGAHSGWNIIGLGLILPGVFLIRGLFSFINGYFMSVTSMIVMKELRSDIFNKLQALPMKFFDQNTHGDLITRIAMDPSTVQNAILQFTAEILKQPMQMLAAFTTLVYVCIQHQSYLMIPLFFITIALAALPIRAVKKGLRANSGNLQHLSGGILHQVSENISAATEVRSFNLQDQEINKHTGHLSNMEKFCLKLVKYQRLQQPVVEFFSATVISVVFLYAYYIQMPFSAFTALGIALYFATDPIKRLSTLFSEMHIAEACIDRIQFVLEAPLEIKDPQNPVSINKLKGDIEFQNVNFSYRHVPTLKNINTHIKAKQKVALVGHSGAGKSTFAKLISRLYANQEGKILIDGMDICEMRLEDLRKNIAIVPQYPVLFHDSILSNIRIGNLDATDDEVIEAAKNAYAHEFIEEFPDKYNNSVGDRGDLLSGGQKQRIAIARAFLKNAPILVLDEATSSLDANSEQLIQKALAKLSENKTVITIAHRLSTIQNSDVIFVFDHGQIVASGSHEELLKTNSIYADLVKNQLFSTAA